MRNIEIVILGLGYSGMITAIALAKEGIKTTIIEKNNLNDKFFIDPRTTSINMKSKNFFAGIGIWEKLKIHAAEVNDIYVMNGNEPNYIRFSKDELGLDEALGYMIPAGDLKKSLFNLVKKNKLIKLISGKGYKDVSFVDDKTFLTLEDETVLNPDLIIVVDGKNSYVKDRFFAHQVSKCYEEAAFVFNIKHEKNHNNAAIEHFLSSGPFALLPLPDQNHSAVVWSLQSELASMYQSLSIGDFTDQVSKILGDFWGKIQITTKIELFNLSAHVVDKYFFKNLVLVGDAAHHIHPLAGQGLNLAISDIASLTSIIAKYISLGLDLNEVALSEYQKSRKMDNFKMFLATDFLDYIFKNQSLLSKTIKKLGFSFLNFFPALKNQIIKTTMY